MPKTSKPTSTLILALLAAGALGGFAATASRDLLDTPAHAAAAPASLPMAVPTTAALPASVAGQALPSLAPMLQSVLPAVVSVQTKQVIRVSPFGNDPIFSQMFPGLTREQLQQSLGSGVIIDAQKGLVLTNHHVIEGAQDVRVTLLDGRTLKAEFVGSDPDTDVALMRIPAQNLTAIPLGNSDQLRVGDFVVAVGNPFGVGQTVTSGIVSAVGRSNLPGMGYQNFIQTDASINPGNSGGALVNLRGELVGINTASFNPRGSMAGNIGLGFAIPSNLAANIEQQLLTNKGGVIRRGTLGIATQDVSARIAKGLGLDEARGAAVTQIYPDSAAGTAGLQVGDVILAANGQRIDDSESLHNFEGLQAPDAKVTLDIRRNGKAMTLTTGLRAQDSVGAVPDPRLAGATFSEVPESLRRQGITGVMVSAVAPGSRAARNDLQQGDVIVGSNGGRFADLAGFRASFSGAPTQLVLRVLRDTGDGLVQGALPMR